MSEDTAPPATPKKVLPPPESKPTQGRPKGSTTKAPPKSVGKIEETLNSYIAGLAMAAAASGDDVSAVVLTIRGPGLASAWAELARINPGVRRALERLTTGGAWSGVIMSTLAVAMPIAEAKGVLPPNVPNLWKLSPEEYDLIQDQRRAKEQFMAGVNG